VEISQLTLSEGSPACDLPDRSAAEEANGKWKQSGDSLPKHTSNPSYSANVVGTLSCPFYVKYVMFLTILDASFKFSSGTISFLRSDRLEPHKIFKDTGKTLSNSDTLIHLSQFLVPFLIICAIQFYLQTTTECCLWNCIQTFWV